jgi:flagellar assembly protein FliH
LFNHTITLNRTVRGIRPVPNVQAKPARRTHLGNSPAELEAIQRVEEEYQERTENAYKFGFEDGRKIGLDEGRKEVRPAVEALQHLLQAFTEERAKLFRDSEVTLLELAVSISRRIIHGEVRTDPSIVQRVIVDSLRLVEERQSIQLKVSAADWQRVKAYERELLDSSHGIRSIEIRADERVEPGGCMIESETGIIDARIQTQLDEISALLLDSAKAVQPAA